MYMDKNNWIEFLNSLHSIQLRKSTVQINVAFIYITLLFLCFLLFSISTLWLKLPVDLNGELGQSFRCIAINENVPIQVFPNLHINCFHKSEQCIIRLILTALGLVLYQSYYLSAVIIQWSFFILVHKSMSYSFLQHCMKDLSKSSTWTMNIYSLPSCISSPFTLRWQDLYLSMCYLNVKDHMTFTPEFYILLAA